MNRADRRRQDRRHKAQRSRGRSGRAPRQYNSTSQEDRERLNERAIRRGQQKRRDDPEHWTLSEVEQRAHARWEQQAGHHVEAADVWDGRVLPVTEPGAYVDGELIRTSTPDYDWHQHWLDRGQTWRATDEQAC